MSLTLIAGDDQSYLVSILKNGAALDLTGLVAASFLAKASVDDADSAALITKTLAGGGITVVAPPTSGRLTIVLAATDSVLLPNSSLSCALKIKDSLNKTYTVFVDTLEIVRSAVRVV